MRQIIALFSVVILSLFGSVAHAQFSFDNDEPITGSADAADYQGKVTVLSGQVDVRQGEVRILSDVMKLYSNTNAQLGEAGYDVDQIEALGNFFYITPDQEVRGENGVYQQSTNTFTVTGNVILLQGDGNVVTGDKLIYDLTSNEARIVGTCKGRRCGKEGRVRILIKNSGSTKPSGS